MTVGHTTKLSLFLSLSRSPHSNGYRTYLELITSYLVVCLSHRIDAFHALGKCSHQRCANENKKISEAIEKTGDFQAKIERCAKCRSKPYEELSDDEKRTLISCIKENEW